MTDHIILTVKDMTCDGCASKVRAALESSSKTSDIEINVANKEVKVWGSISEREAFELVKHAGYSPEPKKKGWLDKIL